MKPGQEIKLDNISDKSSTGLFSLVSNGNSIILIIDCHFVMITLHHLDVGALHDALLAVHALDEAVCEPGGGVGHGEGGAAGAVLGLHNLSPGVLDPLSQGLVK